MNNLSLHAIRSFLLVTQHGSFTAAANAAGMSKANLSQQVSELEARLGAQLFVRTTRKLRLTEVGEGYFRQCEAAMQQLDAAADWASQSTRKLTGSIRINSVGGPIGEELVAASVVSFQKEHPGIQVYLDFSSPKVDLIEKHYDLVVRMGELPDSTLIARKLHQVRTCYVASPDFIAQHGSIKEPEDLSNLPLITGSVDHWALTRKGETRLVHVQNGIRLISGRAMRLAALEGLGVTRLADIYVQRDIAAGRLINVLPNWTQTTPLFMVSPPLRHQLHRVKTLMDYLQPRFAIAYEAGLT
ncbi:MAG: LysR substrate-binding domain-containing protein [Cohaesibacter sp.]|jgi:DNA-binding transcriptional LysR family regulator|nr:LysR substrate-binding domain-containing protein [Cohaesibacter sp.]